MAQKPNEPKDSPLSPSPAHLIFTPDNYFFKSFLRKEMELIREYTRRLYNVENPKEAFSEKIQWTGTANNANQKGQKVKVVLEKISISNDAKLSFKEKGFKFYSKVSTNNNGGVVENSIFPKEGAYHLGEGIINEIIIEEAIFDNHVEDELYIEIGAIEGEAPAPRKSACRHTRILAGRLAFFIGGYQSADFAADIKETNEWDVWYRIEYSD